MNSTHSAQTGPPGHLPMKVSRGQILARGLSNSCPNCGSHTLFPPRSFRINRRCPACKTGLDRGEGFFLGPLVVNYTLCGLAFVLPVLVAAQAGLLSWAPAMALAVFGSVVLPALLYRTMWSWWLMLYFYFLPERLPANGGPIGAEEED